MTTRGDRREYRLDIDDFVFRFLTFSLIFALSFCALNYSKAQGANTFGLFSPLILVLCESLSTCQVLTFFFSYTCFHILHVYLVCLLFFFTALERYILPDFIEPLLSCSLLSLAEDIM